MKKFFCSLNMILTLKCEKSSHLVSDSLDRELTIVERWAVTLHYIGCWSCRRFGKQIRQIRQSLLKRPVSTSEARLTPSAVRRIHEAIESE